MDRLWKKSLLAASTVSIGYAANYRYQTNKAKKYQIDLKSADRHSQWSHRLQTLLPF